MRPLIGITCCTKAFGNYNVVNHAASNTYVKATNQVVEGQPLLIPANGDCADTGTLLERLDGLIFTGSGSNVHPSFYNGPPHPDGTAEDMMRDTMTLPLIREALRVGVPVLAICRGLQELNVALGGTLHQRIQDLPDHIDHSTPAINSPGVRVAKAHALRIRRDGWLHVMAESLEIGVNSLHSQGIDRLAPGLLAEGIAPDGLIEAVSVIGAPGFAIGVQWHPECDFRTEAVSRRIFEAFGRAARANMFTSVRAPRVTETACDPGRFFDSRITSDAH